MILKPRKSENYANKSVLLLYFIIAYLYAWNLAESFIFLPTASIIPPPFLLLFPGPLSLPPLFYF